MSLIGSNSSQSLRLRAVTGSSRAVVVQLSGEEAVPVQKPLHPISEVKSCRESFIFHFNSFKRMVSGVQVLPCDGALAHWHVAGRNNSSFSFQTIPSVISTI